MSELVIKIDLDAIGENIEDSVSHLLRSLADEPDLVRSVLSFGIQGTQLWNTGKSVLRGASIGTIRVES